jgi:hypothetical protein
MKNLLKDTIPTAWRNDWPGMFRNSFNLSSFLSDLASRLQGQLSYKTSIVDGSINSKYWLGGMFFPESFITALRQLTAQVHFYFKYM